MHLGMDGEHSTIEDFSLNEDYRGPFLIDNIGT
jgi:hypothetical protein